MIAAGVLLAVATAVTPLPHTRTGHGPAIVLVHGFGGDRHTWDEVAPELAKSFTVVAVDLPGHGEAPEPANFDADRIAEQIVATVRQEKLSPAIIVGHSLGGFIAAHLRRQPAVKGLVLVDIGIGRLFSEKEVAELQASLAKDREATLRGWFGAISRPAQLERLLVGLGKLSGSTILGYITMLAKQPANPRLAQPTLLMASKLTLPNKKPLAEELAAVGYSDPHGLSVTRFDDSMHWIFWDERDKFLATLTDFARARLR